MDECPHCGEPIEETAERCRHCGSDAETGWSPDRDYYSVELPEEDDDGDGAAREESPAPAAWPTIIHYGLIGTTAVSFLVLNTLAYPGSALTLAVFVVLAVSFGAFHRRLLPRPRRRP